MYCSNLSEQGSHPFHLLILIGLSSLHGGVFALDNGIQSILPSHLPLHAKKISKLIALVCRSPSQPTAFVSKARRVILNFTGVDIGQDGVCLMQYGMVEAVHDLQKRLTVDMLLNTKRHIESLDESMMSLPCPLLLLLLRAHLTLCAGAWMQSMTFFWKSCTSAA